MALPKTNAAFFALWESQEQIGVKFEFYSTKI